MPRFADEAFILGTRDLQERDRIVELLGRAHGRRRAVAQGARARHSRFGGQLQLLAKVHVEWWEREGKDLGRLGAVELLRPARFVERGLEEMLLAFYIAEHVIAFAPEAEADDDLYRLLDTVCTALDAGVERELATAYFEIWILRLAGITPSWRECAGCGEELIEAAWLSPDRDGLLCEQCRQGSGERLDRAALGLLRAMSRTPLAQLAEPPPEAVRAVRAIAAAVRRAYLQEELRSFLVMEETLRAASPRAPTA